MGLPAMRRLTGQLEELSLEVTQAFQYRTILLLLKAK